MLRIVIQTILIVITLLITASVSLAAECTDDPNECTPKKLCEIATETYGSDGKTNWSAAASKAKHVTFAQGLGMTCGVIAALDPCDSDPNECKFSQLCDKATTNSAGQMNWDDSAKAYVALAKEYGLSCDVGSSSGQRQSNTSESDKLMNWILFQGGSKISYGDQAHPNMITLGPKRDERLDTSSYEGNRSLEIRMPLSTPVLAPLDLEFVGYINRTAKMKKSSSGEIKQPYDDLELCFKSINRKTQLVMCVYRARSSPLLPKLFKTKWCNVRPDWDSSERGVPKGGLIYYERNTTKYYDFKKDDVCGVKIGTIIKRGEILAYPGTQGDKTRIDFRFKVYDEKPNSLLDKKKTFNVNLHWVQPTVFFDWECFEDGRAYGSEVLTYPFDCKPLYELNSSEQSDFEEKKEDKSLNKKTYDIANYEKQFKTQSNLRRKQVQSALKKLGYYSSSIDGIWGKGTRAALMDYAVASNMEGESPSKVFSELLNKVDVSNSFPETKVNFDKGVLNTLEANKLLNRILFQGEGDIIFGTPADPDMVTLGPNKDQRLESSPYNGKTSVNIKMPLFTPILAPLDLEFVGYKNRHAKMRKSSSGKVYQPFDDLELCFKSINRHIPLVMCAYHVRSTPLLPKLFKTKWCNVRPDWDVGDSGVPKGGLIYYERNTTKYYDFKKDDVCGSKIGTIIKRGQVLAYSGTVGDNPHTGFRFKVYDEKPNPLLEKDKTFNINLHWVQPSVFFDWQCFEESQTFETEVLTYPFDCKSLL